MRYSGLGVRSVGPVGDFLDIGLWPKIGLIYLDLRDHPHEIRFFGTTHVCPLDFQ